MGTVGRLHQLQIIDHDQVQTMFRLHTARLGTHFHNGKAGGIVNEDIGIVQFFCRSPDAVQQFFFFLIRSFVTAVPGSLSCQFFLRTELICVNICFIINHTLHKLVMIHLQTEKGNAFGLFPVLCAAQGDVFCNVQGQCGFAHGRTRRQDNKIRRMQACGDIVQVGKTGGQPGDGFPVFHQAADAVNVCT